MDSSNTTNGPSTSSAPAAGAHRRPAFQGPCYLKMLVSNLVAGSIIGKNGAVIAAIEERTSVSMKLSPAGCFFPGTNDRVVVMSGEQDHISRALAIVLEKIGEVSAVQDSNDGGAGAGDTTETHCKIIVPKSAVSGIIGKEGKHIKQVQAESGAKIQISDRYGDPSLNERTVCVMGTLQCIHQAATQIATVIQADRNLREHMYVTYHPVAGGGGVAYPSGSQMMSGYGGGHPFGGGGNNNFGYGGGGGGGGGFSGAGPAPAMPHGGDVDHVMGEQCEINIEVPDASIGSLIGKGGVHVSEIIRASGAAVRLSQKGEFVPGTQNRRVTISGPVSSVHRAHTRLLMRLKDSNFGNNNNQRNSHSGSGGYQSASPTPHHPPNHGGSGVYGAGQLGAGHHSHYHQMQPYQSQYGAAY